MTRHEPSYDRRLAELKRLLAEARPEQIQRLLEDICKSGNAEGPKGTA